MGRLPAIALFPAEDEDDEDDEDVPMFKREDAAADAAATRPPPALRPATCAASDRRVTAAAAEDMVEQGRVAMEFVKICEKFSEAKFCGWRPAGRQAATRQQRTDGQKDD